MQNAKWRVNAAIEKSSNDVELMWGGNMLKPIVVAVAISLAFGSFPALAQKKEYKKSCEEFCRAKPCATQGMGSVNGCMSVCVQKCAIRRSGGN